MTTPIELIITREVHAPRAMVFEAWTRSDVIKQWFAPGEMSVTYASVNAQLNGHYEIHMFDPEENETFIVSGTFEEYLPNEKLVLSWKWNHAQEQTEVSVEFVEQDTALTLVVLSHRRFSKQEFADNHNKGWQGCLDKLVHSFNSHH